MKYPSLHFLFLAGALSLLLAACSSPRCTEPWRSVLKQYAPDEAVQELLLVRYEQGSDATVFFYQKQGGRWKKVRQGAAYVGKNGLGKSAEGDAKTPEGDFGVLTAFGVLPDPGTALPWIPVTASTFACDEEGPFYNRIIDTVATHHPCKGEDMLHTVPQYNYGMALDFNPDCRYPEGSAIFFHCKGPKPYTGGCIAVDEDFMVQILTLARPGLRVVIH
jgi:L,D-peptidoglycan transpeptidase YkuD (ErfK/YbiS/YcfS/YnhG family)